MKINYTTGYAGTGKSTKLLEQLHHVPEETTVVICPTHKAIERLKSNYEGNIEIKTIYSLLGLIPRINENAKHISQLNTLVKLDHPIEHYTNIIIDEAGMISEDIFLELIGRLEEKEFEDPNFKVTFDLYLDPYQLLPVKGYQLQTDPATTTNLTVQYRSESKDIVETYTRFVEYIQGIGNDLSVEYSDNIKPLDIKNFKRGDRLLAYTNKQVGEWNQRIAKHLGIEGYEGQEVQLGVNEFCVVDKFENPTPKDLHKAYNSGKLHLQNKQINKRYLNNALEALLTTEGIEFISSEGKLIPVIVGIGNAKTILDDAGNEAIKNRSKFVHVYALGRAFIMDYPFATTVHKSQGSEFESVFVDKLDIQKSIRNNYFETYARLMYVAISRCKKTLYI